VFVLGLLSWQRTWSYESYERLWTDTVAQDPNCWLGHNNLGAVYLQKGRVDEALANFQKALEIHPRYADAHYNMGEAFALKGDMDQAIVEYEKALEIDPNDVDTHDNLGLAFLQMRKANEAMVQFREALRLKPDDGNAQVYLTKAEVMARQNHPSPSR